MIRLKLCLLILILLVLYLTFLLSLQYFLFLSEVFRFLDLIFLVLFLIPLVLIPKRCKGSTTRIYKKRETSARIPKKTIDSSLRCLSSRGFLDKKKRVNPNYQGSHKKQYYYSITDKYPLLV